MKAETKIADTVLKIISEGTTVIYIAKAFDDFAATYITPNIENQLGYTQDEFLASPEFWANHIHPDDRKRVMKELSTLFETNHYTHEYRFQHKDGSYRWMHDELTLLRNDDGSPLEIIGHWIDVTERKQAELKLIDAKENAEEANKVKSRFLSIMSHELRTPMNAILGFGQLLEHDKDSLNEVQNDNINEIIVASHHLITLINDLLDLSIIESGKMEVSPDDICLDDVLTQCIGLITPLAETHQIKIINNIQSNVYTVKADYTRLKQVVLNLLSNAVKYGNDCNQVTLDSELVDNKRLRIRVTDTGQGLTEEDIAKLFTSFERLDITSNIEGAGLGLIISKYLVELMGGSIGIESTLGEGSTFWVEIALSKSG